MGNRILLWFCAPFVAVAVLGALCGSALSYLLSVLLFSVFCFVLLLRGGKRKACAALCIGVCFSLIWQSFWFCGDKLPMSLYEKLPEIGVRSVSYSEKTKSEKGICFEAEVLDIGKDVRLRVYVSESDESICPNDIIELNGNVQQLENDEYFAEKTYYKSRGIDAIFFADEMKVIERNSGIALKTIPCIVAESVKDKIDELYDGEAGAILKSLILGDTDDVSDEFYNDLRATGLAHAVSVSGMHIAFIVGFLIIFSKNKYLKLFAIPVILSFALIVGAPQSALRAVVMQSIIILSHVCMRESDSLTNVSFAAFLLVMINPYCASDVAFLLSFTSTVGIVVLYERIMNPLMCLAPKRKGKLRKFCASVFCIVAVSVSASIATSPITAYSFGKISVIAPLTNVLLNGIITLVFVSGFLDIIVGFICMPIAKGVAFVIEYIILFMKNAITLLARLPVTEIFTGDIKTVLFITFLCAVVVLALLSGRKKIRLSHFISAIIIAFSAFVVINAITGEKIPDDKIRFDVLDVGQGQCIVAAMGEDCVVVDCGGDKPSDNICVSHLLKCGVDDIDKLILTHAHADHISGVPYLLSSFDVKEIYVPLHCKEDEELSEILEVAKDKKIIYVEEDMDMSLSDDMKISLLTLKENKEENESGISVVIADGDYELLITGDLPSKCEKELIARIPDCESFIAGHHGSSSSNSLAILNKALPELCVVSVGLDNRYGHPSENVLMRFEKIGATVGRTDYDGSITFYSEKVKRNDSDAK